MHLLVHADNDASIKQSTPTIKTKALVTTPSCTLPLHPLYSDLPTVTRVSVLRETLPKRDE
jgi:hypothetical protein